jgi:hypothetical protein
MKRLLIVAALAGLISACVHPWVGRPASQLTREMGLPLRIRTEGTNRIYVYPDTLAGRGVMTFTVDSKGIIRDWDATSEVPSVFGTDVIGTDSNSSGLPVP